jgi:hypothetical protein
MRGAADRDALELALEAVFARLGCASGNAMGFSTRGGPIPRGQGDRMLGRAPMFAGVDDSSRRRTRCRPVVPSP